MSHASIGSNNTPTSIARPRCRRASRLPARSMQAEACMQLTTRPCSRGHHLELFGLSWPAWTNFARSHSVQAMSTPQNASQIISPIFPSGLNPSSQHTDFPPLRWFIGKDDWLLNDDSLILTSTRGQRKTTRLTAGCKGQVPLRSCGSWAMTFPATTGTFLLTRLAP